MRNKNILAKVLLSVLLVVGILLSTASCFMLPAQEKKPTEATTPTSAKQADPDEPNEPNQPNQPNEPNQPVVTMLPSQEVKVLGQNLLNGNATAVAERSPTMIAYMRALGLDSIGVQEAGAAWADALDAGLGDLYARVGVECGTGADKGSFATYVYYLKSKYRVIASDTFWLSTTPDIPSKYSDTVDMNRTCTWVILENIQTGFRYVHVNCHADHKDKTVNVVQFQMIRDLILRFEAMGYPVFATGDYNSGEGLTAYGQMIADERIADARYETENTDSTVSHFGNNKSIDFCFVTCEKMDVLQFDVVENDHDGVTVSDHNGIYTHAKVHSLPTQDHSITIPEFKNEALIRFTEHSATRSRINLIFEQARSADGSVAQRYELTVHDSTGKLFTKTTVFGNAQREHQPITVSTILTGGSPGTTYLVKITPYSLLGVPGKAIEREFVWAGDPIVPIQPDTPDILDISVINGVVTDSSPNHTQMTQIGDVTVTSNAMKFDKMGNIRTDSIASQYEKMVDGFTLTATIKTGNDVSTGCYVNNHHAGGFGFCYDNARRFVFSVHNGTSYIYAYTSLEKNTTYHITGVFDGEYIMLYVNGTLVSIEPLEGDMKFPTHDGAKYLCIGADSSADGKGEYPSDVTVYTVGLYSDILTEEEILYLAQHQ